MTANSILPETVTGSRAYQILERSMESGRLAHAILLHGESPKVLEAVARAVAGRLLEAERPLEHPDCFLLRPSGKARMIRVGESDESNTMRQLVVNIQKSSNQGGRKVGIVFEADRMNTASANAFLKTLEEPPAGTTLILLTTRPYDLLDTIRSRCLNFRVPAALEEIPHADWSRWTQDYLEWLRLLLAGPTKSTVPHMILGAYGLNVRFQTILAEMTKTEWQLLRDDLPDHVTKEQREAMEVGLAKGFRKQLFGELEKTTARFARYVEQHNPGQLPATALYRAVESLERTVGLLELNFNEAAALERFFLSSLRIWVAS